MHIFLTTKSRNHHWKNRFALFQLCPQLGHFIANIVGLGFRKGVYIIGKFDLTQIDHIVRTKVM